VVYSFIDEATGWTAGGVVILFNTGVLHLPQTVSGTLSASYSEVNVKVKSIVHTRTGHEGPEGK